MTENIDLQSMNQTKERELAEAQQQLREKVNGVKCMCSVLCVTRSPPDCRRSS